jgi:hypothetical protein
MIRRFLEETFEDLIDECQRDGNQEKIKERVLDPLICYLMDKMYPYLLVSITVVVLLIALSIMILFLLLRR